MPPCTAPFPSLRPPRSLLHKPAESSDLCSILRDIPPFRVEAPRDKTKFYWWARCPSLPRSYAAIPRGLRRSSPVCTMTSRAKLSKVKRKDEEENNTSGGNASKKPKKEAANIEPKEEPENFQVALGEDVHQGRVRVVQQGQKDKKGPVVYWMSRDQRSRDNWALLYAAEQARTRESPLAVIFNLVDNFLDAKARHFGFMLRGLRVVERNLKDVGIPFFLLQGKSEENIPVFLEGCSASVLVMDFSPMRIGRTWREGVSQRVSSAIAVYEVDAHNVVPIWISSDKQEYSARTIRTKIQRQLPDYLADFPSLEPPSKLWTAGPPQTVKWDVLIEQISRKGAEVPEITWCESGEDAALEMLIGKKNGFLTTRIRNYADDRNDPSKPSALSGLSPYLHYGQISAQRCAVEARKLRKSHTKAIDAFLEELIIRRELADNFCYYQPHYDSLQGASEWARKTLLDHASDKREHIYTQDELEKGKTHDELWNAAQLEMVHFGKMHGFMRMYWAKKILEWTTRPEEALAISIYLNDKYEIDGRDPNGYVGCMWSICGIHDQGWQERPVFGKIRYMNYNGCKRKFNVDGYIMYVKRVVSELKRKTKELGSVGLSFTPSKTSVK